MNLELSQSDNINVLISDANWAWPQAVSKIFQPRGINALVAESTNEIVHIVNSNKIHMAILDAATPGQSAMHSLKVIRKHDKLLPCLLLAQKTDNRLLSQALDLKVFSVLIKPVDMVQLTEQINRLFKKYYKSNIFDEEITENHIQ